jgi:undecaprenyl diphosphate synthase
MSSTQVPRHLAIIMDGNGRWAELRNHDRTFGHLKGARVAKTTIETCVNLGVEYLTLYAFSTENWLRPKAEVSFLMMLLARHLRKERRTLMKNNIRFSVIGDLSRLPEGVISEVKRTIEETRNNTGMNLVFALSYGGRQEITEAVRSLAREVAEGRITPEQIDESVVAKHLQSSFLPDPDLIIRTSGEFRLSNFLLWQAAYSELYITQTLWPAFTTDELKIAFAKFASRERRFGRTTAQMNAQAHPQTRGFSISDLAEATAIRKVTV